MLDLAGRGSAKVTLDGQVTAAALLCTGGRRKQMCVDESEELHIDLTYTEVEELAYRAQEGHTDSMVLLLEGIREKSRTTDVDLIVHSAVTEIIHLTSEYGQLRTECIRRLLKKFRTNSQL
jgi:hypothetical protein